MSNAGRAPELAQATESGANERTAADPNSELSALDARWRATILQKTLDRFPECRETLFTPSGIPVIWRSIFSYPVFLQACPW